MKKKTLVQSFRIVIAVLFVFSAISKILSLPFFDGLVAKLFIGKNYYDHPEAFVLIQIFTRLIIAGEMLLGVAVLQRKYLKKIVLPTIMGILSLFTIHLFYEGFTDKFIGGNCGCFGDLVPMDNFESIIKNVVAMMLVVYIWKNYKKQHEMRFRSWVFPVVVGAVTMATLLLTVKNVGKKVEVKQYTATETSAKHSEIEETATSIIDTTAVVEIIDKTKTEEKQAVKEKTAQKQVTQQEETIVQPKEKEEPKVKEPASIFSGYTEFQNEGGGVELDQGRKMICMFSLTCGHCQEAYRDICAMADQGGFPPIYLFLYGDSEDQFNYFFNQAGCKHPYIFIQDYIEFERLLEGKDFPRVLDRINGKNQQEWDLESYSKESLAEYFGLEVPVEEGNGLGF